MEDAKLTYNDINKVILVGGSTRIPAVVEAVKKLTGKEPYKGINPDECVAMGAAIQAGILAGDVNDVILLDVTPLSLGIETLGGVCTKIIDRNTTIPTSKSQIFSTAADNQTSVSIHVLQGERPMAADNKTLGRFELTGIPPARRGIPQIEVKFDIDANGIVHVTATDKGTNKAQSIEITASTNLSEEEIDKAVKDAEKYAEEDKKRQEAVEEKNRLDATIIQMETLVRENGDKFDSNDKAKLEEEIKKAKEALEKGDPESVRRASEELTNNTAPIIQKMYQQTQGGQQGPQGGAQEGSSDGVDYDIKDAD